MGRRPRASSLAVWANGQRMGLWRIDSRGVHEFRYEPEWISSSSAYPLSLSMPLRPLEPYRGDVVHDFFENLLPDTRALRQRLQAQFMTRSIQAFDLLSEIGRDCVGALQILPDDAAPPDVKGISGEELVEEEIEGILAGISGPRLAGRNSARPFRISLAGAHEKTALLAHEGRWFLPSGPTPTTHILKPPIGRLEHAEIDMSDSVENEWLCHRILQEFQVPVADCRIGVFGTRKALVVERFDRRWERVGPWIRRLPQEDFCQATRTPGALKYEADGGPGVRRVMDLLQGSASPRGDRRDFFRTQVVFWLLCAIDGHAKNFSLLLEAGGRFRLAPRYDVLSVHPVLGHGAGRLSPHEVKMAMAAWGRNRHYEWNRVSRRHWLRMGADCGLPEVESLLDELTASTPRVVEAVQGTLPAGFPGRVSDRILAGLTSAAEKLATEVARQ